METVVQMLVMGVMCLLCFIVGARVGQTVSKGEEVKVPELNPFNGYQERNAKRQSEKEQERLEIILQNVECYDGTGIGQKDVPGA